MRRGTNVKYTLDQKELVKFIRDVRQLSHITDDQLKEYCDSYGSEVLYRGKLEIYYNPGDAMNNLYWNYGMVCPICDEHYSPRNTDDCRMPYELRITMLPELPAISGNYCLTFLPMCRGCMIKYKKYINMWYVKKEINDWDDRMKLPIKFLGVTARRISKGQI